jgi:predicted nucleic acid-binding protein
MIVIAASVLANALAGDDADGRLARRELRAADELTAPDLIDVETVSVLRKRWRRGTLTDDRLNAAVKHLVVVDVPACLDVTAVVVLAVMVAEAVVEQNPPINSNSYTAMRSRSS